MAIPTNQLETWSSQGAMVSSSQTYNSIKSAIETITAKDDRLKVSTYLQGSYGNDTNVYKESDVDIVVQLESFEGSEIFYSNLNEEQKASLRFTTGAFGTDEFRNFYYLELQKIFGAGSMSLGSKSVKIAGEGNRRYADIIFVFPYHSYNSLNPTDYIKGIAFKANTIGKELIINYPKQHSANGTTFHASTSNRFKPMVRVFKNVRNYLADKNVITKKQAPSYLIEGMLSNIPAHLYSNDKQQTFVNIVGHAKQADYQSMLCLNKLRPLFGNNGDQWNTGDADSFLFACYNLYKNWQ